MSGVTEQWRYELFGAGFDVTALAINVRTTKDQERQPGVGWVRQHKDITRAACRRGQRPERVSPCPASATSSSAPQPSATRWTCSTVLVAALVQSIERDPSSVLIEAALPCRHEAHNQPAQARVHTSELGSTPPASTPADTGSITPIA